MMRKVVISACLLIFCWDLVPADMEETAADEAGYVLLQDLVSGFGRMVQTGTGGYEVVNEMVQQRMADLKQARNEGQIDDVFFMRYHRMLEIIKLTIIDEPYDPEGILDDFIVKELEMFILDVSGIPADIDQNKGEGKPSRGIGLIAGALAEEILNLHGYLDMKKGRKKLLEKYFAFTGK